MSVGVNIISCNQALEGIKRLVFERSVAHRSSTVTVALRALRSTETTFMSWRSSGFEVLRLETDYINLYNLTNLCNLTNLTGCLKDFERFWKIRAMPQRVFWGQLAQKHFLSQAMSPSPEQKMIPTYSKIPTIAVLAYWTCQTLAK